MALTALADFVNTIAILAPAMVIRDSCTHGCSLPSFLNQIRCALPHCRGCLGNQYAEAISHRGAYVIAAYMIALAMVIAACVSWLEIDEAPPNMLPAAHPVQIQNVLLNTGKSSGVILLSQTNISQHFRCITLLT